MAEEQAASATGRVDVDALYRAHMRPLYAFIYGKVGNREAAEDLTSEVFMKALVHLDLAREERSIAAWLYRVARNAVNDYWRAGYSARVIPFEEALLARPAPLPAQASPQVTRRARAVLEQLPDSYRAVLSCRLLEGLTVDETARRMGISPAYVKVLQHRALKRAANLRRTSEPAVMRQAM